MNPDSLLIAITVLHYFNATAKAPHFFNCLLLNCKVASGRHLKEPDAEFVLQQRALKKHCGKWEGQNRTWVTLQSECCFKTLHPFKSQRCSKWPAVQDSGIQQASESILSMLSFRAPPSSQKLGAIGPGMDPQGEVSAYSSSGAAYSTLAGFDAFRAHCADPFRNSAETTDTSLDCRCSPDLLLHVDLLAPSLPFWSLFPSSSAPGGCQCWLKGLPGGFKGPFNPSSRS